MAKIAAFTRQPLRLPLRLVLMLLCAIGFALVPLAMMPMPAHGMAAHAAPAPMLSHADSAMPDCHTQMGHTQMGQMETGQAGDDPVPEPRSAMQQLICALSCAAVAPSVELAIMVPERLDAVPHASAMPALSGISGLPEARPPRNPA